MRFCRHPITVIAAPVIAAILLLFSGREARSSGRDGCLDFIPAAEHYFNLPQGLLTAVALTESGQNGVPQPLALNIAGAPVLAPSFQVAARFLRRPDGVPRRDVAVGCMQIHMHYHLEPFGIPERALDPEVNVWYGAALLAQLRQQYGNWIAAIGHYNASNPTAQRHYLCAVARRLMTTSPADGHRVYATYCAAELAARVPPRGIRPSLMTARRVGRIIVLGAER